MTFYSFLCLVSVRSRHFLCELTHPFRECSEGPNGVPLILRSVFPNWPQRKEYVLHASYNLAWPSCRWSRFFLYLRQCGVRPWLDNASTTQSLNHDPSLRLARWGNYQGNHPPLGHLRWLSACGLDRSRTSQLHRPDICTWAGVVLA